MVVSLVKEMEKNKKWVISAAVVALVLSVLLNFTFSDRSFDHGSDHGSRWMVCEILES